METWWAGTTGGLAFSRDAGRTWRTLTVADRLPSNLVLCAAGDRDGDCAGTDGGVWTGTAEGQFRRAYGPDDGVRGLVVKCASDALAAIHGGVSFVPARGGSGPWRQSIIPARHRRE